MKKPNWILLIGLGVAAWYFLKKKKPGVVAPLATIIPGSSAKQAASEASQLVSDVVDKTTFVPDLTTDRDLYIKDQTACK